jgi:Flp pilus assembly protein CpaB
VSRRARAIGFACAALACAALAATIASGYSGRVATQFGPLHPAVVAAGDLAPKDELRPADVRRLLVMRRVPERFVPPDAIASPQAAIGLVPAARIPAGSYVLAGQLRPPRSPREDPGLAAGAGRQPVELAVTGADALAVGGRDPTGMRVDVVVTTEPKAGGSPGRTYVAAASVRLLALGRGPDGAQSGDALPPAGWMATLALTRAQALRLIQAESYARSIRLIAAR